MTRRLLFNSSHSHVFDFSFYRVFFYLFPHFFRTKKKIIVQTTSYHFICKISWNTVSGWLQAGLRNSLHLCIRDARKWRENEEMKRSSLSTFTHYLFISSLSLHFLYLSKFVTFCRKHFCCECHKKLIICVMRKYGSNSLRGSSISCASLAGSHFFWY